MAINLLHAMAAGDQTTIPPEYGIAVHKFVKTTDRVAANVPANSLSAFVCKVINLGAVVVRLGFTEIQEPPKNDLWDATLLGATNGMCGGSNRKAALSHFNLLVFVIDIRRGNSVIHSELFRIFCPDNGGDRAFLKAGIDFGETRQIFSNRHGDLKCHAVGRYEEKVPFRQQFLSWNGTCGNVRNTA